MFDEVGECISGCVADVPLYSGVFRSSGGDVSRPPLGPVILWLGHRSLAHLPSASIAVCVCVYVRDVCCGVAAKSKIPPFYFIWVQTVV